MLLPILTDTEIKLLSSFGLMIVLWLLGRFAVRLVNRNIEEVKGRQAWRHAINVTSSALAMLLLVRIWFEWFQSVLTLLSVIAAALTIVSKEILNNLFSYTIIMWRGLFRIGDRVQIGTTIGDVVQLGPMYISLVETGGGELGDMASGRFVKVPNKEVIDKHVINYSRGHNLVWNELELKLSPLADWKKAKALLEEILARESVKLGERELEKIRDRNEDMMFLRKDPVVLMRMDGDKLIFTARYLCKIRQKRTSAHRIWEDILELFPQHPELQFPKPKKKPGEADPPADE